MRRLATALLLALVSAQAEDLPVVPAVRFELLPGEKVNVVVDNKVHPLDAAVADTLRKALDAVDLAAVRADVSKLRDALRRADKAGDEAELKAAGVA